MIPTCPYCGAQAMLEDSAVVYQGKSYGKIWICPYYPDCDSYVGVHRGTETPLGRMANAELRQAKRAAHAAFDPLWRGKKSGARKKAYSWLADCLGIPPDECHIGMFDVAQCEAVVRLCRGVTI